MQKLLSGLPPVVDEKLIVGYATNDDAGVYCLTDDIAVVVTADFITPPFDDPVLFGQIGAANALSDIYAMGGRPVTCVNLVAFPSKKLGPEVLAGIISGAAAKIAEAGAVLAGGHTVDDLEPKFGLAVTGVVHPQQVWRNSTAREGDALVLTKPVGSGALLNANLTGKVDPADLAALEASLTTLNRAAAETAREFEVHAATDITGFGLACHTLEMARGAGLRFELEFASVPVFGGALDMYRRGVTTGSNAANREMARADVDLGAALGRPEQELLFDPQTNGGLLLAVPDAQGDALVARLRDAGVADAVRVGTVAHRRDGPFVEIR